MKTTISVPRNIRASRTMIVSLVICTIAFIAMLIFSSICVTDVTLDNCHTESGVVLSVEKDEKQEQNYVLTLEGGKKFAITGVITDALTLGKAQEAVGHEVILYLYDFGSNYGIVGIEGDEIFFAKELGLQLEYNNWLTTTLIIAGFSLFFLALTIFLIVKNARAGKFQELDIFKYTIKFRINTYPKQKKLNITMLIIVGFFLASMVPVVIFGELDDTSPLFYTFFSLMILVFLVLCSMPFWMFKFLRKDSVPFYLKQFDFIESDFVEESYGKVVYDRYNSMYFEFAEKALVYNPDKVRQYRDELYNHLLQDSLLFAEQTKDSKTKEYVESQIKEFKEKGDEYFSEMVPEGEIDPFDELAIKFPNNISLNYSDLKLYVKAVFYPAGAVNVYILSDIDDINAQGLEYNLFFELDAQFYNYAKKYNIPVEGLEYFLQNKEELAKKYCKGKIKHVTLNNDGEVKVEKYLP